MYCFASNDSEMVVDSSPWDGQGAESFNLVRAIVLARSTASTRCEEKEERESWRCQVERVARLR